MGIKWDQKGITWGSDGIRRESDGVRWDQMGSNGVRWGQMGWGWGKWGIRWGSDGDQMESDGDQMGSDACERPPCREARSGHGSLLLARSAARSAQRHGAVPDSPVGKGTIPSSWPTSRIITLFVIVLRHSTGCVQTLGHSITRLCSNLGS